MSYHVLLWHHTTTLAYTNTPPQATEGPKTIKIQPRHPHHLLWVLSLSKPFLVFRSLMTRKDNPICNDLYHRNYNRWYRKMENNDDVALSLGAKWAFGRLRQCGEQWWCDTLSLGAKWAFGRLRQSCAFGRHGWAFNRLVNGVLSVSTTSDAEVRFWTEVRNLNLLNRTEVRSRFRFGPGSLMPGSVHGSMYK